MFRKTGLVFALICITSFGFGQLGKVVNCKPGNFAGRNDFCCKATSSDSWSCTNGTCWTCFGDCLPEHVDQECLDQML